MSDNPLLKEFDGPFNSAPFSKIKNEHYVPALKVEIEKSKKIIEEISNEANPTFENIIERLESCDSGVGLISTIFFNLNSAESNEEMQEIAKEFTALYTEFSNDIVLNEKLFKNVEHVYGERSNFSGEQLVLLEKTYKNFTRNGALLNDEQKSQLRDIDQKLSLAGLAFGDNLLADTNAFLLVIDTEEEVEGLPSSSLAAAKELAKEKGHDGKLCFNLDYPSYIPFVKYVKNRELREKMYRGNASKGFNDNEYNNCTPVKDIVNLRIKRANLLGYKNHAEFVLEERMAKNPTTTQKFIADMLEKSLPAAKRDAQELRDFAKRTDGLENVEKWDINYYMESLKKEKFELSDDVLKPYFELSKVLDGAFSVANKLYDLNFELVDNVDKYHEDVEVYKVTDSSGELVSLFYADFFPRAGKRSGAWMTSFRGQCKTNGNNQRPHISIVCNFPKPSAANPSLLSFDDSLTLFHEFGHALHGMLANTHYESLSGTSGYWAFVELPSQILENWVYEKECLELFAKHYETNEVIPFELVQKIKDSSQFFEGYATLRQLSFCRIDMSWHSLESEFTGDVQKFEEDALDDLELWPLVSGSCLSTGFGHIFKGGYSAGYYSYKWAEVLDADAFETFKEKGIFDTETAKSFRDNILSKGGSEHPMELYKKFKGAEPKVDALLRRSGLLN